MKKIRYIVWLALCVIGMTACQDELIENASAGGADINKPVKVELKFGLPRSPEIAVTRANNEISGIYAVRLFIFNTNGNYLATPEDITTLIAGAADNEGQHYTAQTTLYEGKQRVYAVANITRTGYVQDIETFANTLQSAAEKGEEKFKKVCYDLAESPYNTGSFPAVTTNFIPLSGFGEIEVSTNGGTSGIVQAVGTVQLKRLVAQIKLKIKTTFEKEDKNKVTFIPTTYTFYNIPKRAYVLSGSDQDAITDDDNFYNTHSFEFPGASTSGQVEVNEGIYVPESMQTVKQDGCDTYNERESFSGTGNSKKWMYAPDKGMYVVIEGHYSEVNSEDVPVYYGDNMRYTIHLGDFSDDKYSNFSVERNCIYTYTISVQGVDKVIAEAKQEKLDEGYQNGAEGNIVDLQSFAKVFNLDSHYEQVYMEYDLTAIANELPDDLDEEKLKENIAENFMLSIHTPMMNSVIDIVKPYNNTDAEETAMHGVDYKWVEFYPQTDANKISSYPSSDNKSKLLTPWQVCQELGKAVYHIYNKSEDITGSLIHIVDDENHKVARFTIFVNENYYEEDLEGNKIGWDEFTNTDSRSMMIVSKTFVSEDGNSTYTIPWTYITQRSIETFYNPAVAENENALGIETYNENGAIEGMGTSYSIGEATDGRTATIRCINNVDRKTDLDDNSIEWNFSWNDVGYLDTNTSSGNYIKDVNENNAAWACLARNRDLDGDGFVDNDELRWYLPALSQYQRIGIGTRALSSTARLYTGDKMDLVLDEDNDYITEAAVNDGALYYTSTTHDNYYWAVEVGAYGSSGKSKKAQVRCVRNLPSKAVVETSKTEVDRVNALAGPLYGTLKQTASDNYLFDFGNKLPSSLLRATDIPQLGSYLPHDENSYLTNLPEAFVVSTDAMTFSQTVGNVINDQSDPCSEYSEEEDESDKELWRVPNLNELMVMVTQADVLGFLKNPDGLTYPKYMVLSRTKFSNQSVRKIFYYNGRFITTAFIDSGMVRCVRDATKTERETAK